MKVEPNLQYDLKLTRKLKDKSDDFERFITYFFPVTFHAYREGADFSVLGKLKGAERQLAIEIIRANLPLKDKNSYIVKAAEFFGISE